jgi:site-specific DNA-methyltransferase (adenine-specific)
MQKSLNIAQMPHYCKTLVRRSVLFHDDCFNILSNIENESIDLILCDLPYGTTKCKWDNILPFDKLWAEYERIIAKNGAIVLTAKQPFTSVLVNSNLKLYREHLIWIKHKPTNFANGKYMHLNYTEDIIVFGKGKTTYNPIMQERKSERVKQSQNGKSKNWRSKPKTENEVAFSTDYEPREWTCYNADKKLPMNYIKIPSVVSNSREKVNHPTQKPIALMEYLVSTYSNENDIVLDNCMGSNTTGLACQRLNRQFIGIEKEKAYYDISVKRLSETLF